MERQYPKVLLDPKPDYFERTDCRLCGGPLGRRLDFGPTPLANEYPSAPVNRGQTHYPLYLSTCQTCNHVQLPVVVNPEILFRDYAYMSSTSSVFVEHLRAFARDVQPKPGGFVVEIGSNDGTLLREYRRLGFDTLGVDPARNLSYMAMTQGVPTVVDFFDERVAALIGERRKADLIIANNVFAHSDDLLGIIRAVKRLLADDGKFVFEVGYLPAMIAAGNWRVCYHEHTAYHHLGPLMSAFERHGLALVDAELVATQGGSVRCTVRQDDVRKSERLLAMLAAETPGAINVGRLANNIAHDRMAMQQRLARWRAEGKTIAGYGAPAQLTTLCYALGLTRQDVDFVCDDNPLKQGRFTPGLFIPIVDPRELELRKPDVCLIFSRAFEADIRQRNAGFKGEWVVI